MQRPIAWTNPPTTLAQTTIISLNNGACYKGNAKSHYLVAQSTCGSRNRSEKTSSVSPQVWSILAVVAHRKGQRCPSAQTYDFRSHWNLLRLCRLKSASQRSLKLLCQSCMQSAATRSFRKTPKINFSTYKGGKRSTKREKWPIFC